MEGRPQPLAAAGGGRHDDSDNVSMSFRDVRLYSGSLQIRSVSHPTPRGCWALGPAGQVLWFKSTVLFISVGVSRTCVQSPSVPQCVLYFGCKPHLPNLPRGAAEGDLPLYVFTFLAQPSGLPRKMPGLCVAAHSVAH